MQQGINAKEEVQAEAHMASNEFLYDEPDAEGDVDD